MLHLVEGPTVPDNPVTTSVKEAQRDAVSMAARTVVRKRSS